MGKYKSRLDLNTYGSIRIWFKILTLFGLENCQSQVVKEAKTSDYILV